MSIHNTLRGGALRRALVGGKAPQARDVTKAPYRGSWYPGAADGDWSFWNSPIRADAVLEDSGLQNHVDVLMRDGVLRSMSKTIRTDPIHIGYTKHPVKRFSAAKRSDGTTWEQREPWKGGTHSVGVHIDPTDTGPGDYTRGNSLAAFAVENDRTRVWQGHPLKLAAGGDATVRYVDPHAAPDDLFGRGAYGAHGGSHMSALGCIRHDEWDAEEEDSIRRVIGYNIWCAAYIEGLPQGFTSSNKPKRWPANSVDSYWDHDGNGGRPLNKLHYGQRAVAPGMKMGALLALPDTFVTPSGTDPKARKIIRTMRDFGVVVVDDSAYEVHQLSVERTIPWPSSTATAFHRPLFEAFINLKLVNSNGPTQPGGGTGTPRARLVEDVTR